MSAYIQGILVGLTFAFLLGPGFFALVQTSIRSGFRAGMGLSIGIFLSDLTILLLCYFGIGQFLGDDPRQNTWLQLIGGIILMVLGIYTFNRKMVQTEPPAGQLTAVRRNRRYLYLIKGFLLNAFNPGIWFLWITVTVTAGAKYGGRSVGIFLIGILSTTLSADLLKSYFFHRIRRFCGLRTITRINHGVGVILIVFGMALMFFLNRS